MLQTEARPLQRSPLTECAFGPTSDWLSFLARIRAAQYDRADLLILRWQGCPAKVMYLDTLF